MKDLFYMGGPLFMGILTTLLLLMLVYAVFNLIAFLQTKNGDYSRIQRRLPHIKTIGLFSMITGIFAQLIGLYTAFAAIEKAVDISPAIIFGGLKISMISTLYGIIIYLLSLALWFVLNLSTEKRGD